jgi:radical SAM protein with 4Fe4S-binding SPASM domain
MNAMTHTQAMLRSVVRCVRRAINRELNELSYNRQSLTGPGQPEVFQVELTNHCPMTCVMCPRTESMTRALGYMDQNLFERVVRQIGTFSSKVFLHHFGDSLVHPNLGSLIRYATERHIKCFLSTNAALLTEKRARELVDSGLEELVVSLDGVTSATNVAIRGRAAHDVADAERKIRFLLTYRRERKSKKPRIIMQFVLQKMNQHEAGEWMKKWTSIPEIDAVKIKSYITWTGQHDRINLLRIAPAPESNGLVCDKPWTSVTILWDGRVVPCCFDYDAQYVLGDLKRQSLRDIWNGEQMLALRRAHREGKQCNIRLCARCTDKEGYPVRRWYYPLNRWLSRRTPLAWQEKL